MEHTGLRAQGSLWIRVAVWLTLLMVALGPAVRQAFGEAHPVTNKVVVASIEAPSSAISSSFDRSFLVRPAMTPLPRPEQPKFVDHALYLAIAAYRTMDLVSTQHAIALGAREVELPQWVVANTATFAAFEGLATAGEVGASVWLIHRHHRRLARTVNMVSISLGTNTVLHNYHQSLWSPVTGGR